MFETFGEEFEQVMRYAHTKQVFTLIESEDDSEETAGGVVVRGVHFVNRIGYFIAKPTLDEVKHEKRD